MHDVRCAALRAELRALASDQARVLTEREAFIAPKVNYRTINNIANISSIMHHHQLAQKVHCMCTLRANTLSG